MRKILPILILLACAAIFACTFYFLLRERFQTGDVYPASSSLRSDPLGTMVLYESLELLPGLRVSRDHKAVNALPEGKNITYLHLAGNRSTLNSAPQDLDRALDLFLLSGGRLIITLSPVYEIRLKKKDGSPLSKEELDPEHKGDDSEKDDKPSKDKTEKKEKDAKKGSKEKLEEEVNTVSLQEKWGFHFDLVRDDKAKNGEFLAYKETDLPLPEELRWHGEVVLKDLNPAWKVLYSSDRGAVMAERTRGPGSIVIATDSFFISNEALAEDRHPDLLSWIVGPSTHIIFDEAHLGIANTPGIASLARKYRLHGAVAALVILAALFVWKNISRLAPPRRSAGESPDFVPGRDSAAGFVGLLRRNIPRDTVLEVCLDEWRKAFAHGTRFNAAEKASVETITHAEQSQPSRSREPLEAYRRICHALRRKNTKPIS